MDEDLTASHWDDVMPPSATNLASSNVSLIFGTLNLDDPHRDPTENNSEELNDDESSDKDPENDETEKAEEYSHRQNFRDAYCPLALPFHASKAFNQYELDEINVIKKQQRETHKSSLLMELTSGVEEHEFAEKTGSPVKLGASESLFEDKGSPLKIEPLSQSAGEPSARAALENSFLSPTKASLLKSGKFKVARSRKIPAKTVIKHLDEGQNDNDAANIDPLSSLSVPQIASLDQTAPVDKPQTLFQAANMPLYELPNLHNLEHTEDNQDHQPVLPLSPERAEPEKKNTNVLEISLGDPVKVGDITTAHIVYGIKTENKNAQSAYFPQSNDTFFVSRRYKDFRWIYHQLQNNHPGKFIPPPPSKQTYIGRFNENFVENRRQSLEKMLHKISAIPVLADDGDFVLFLTSQNFANDAKEREQASSSGASIQASNGYDDGDKASTSIVTGTAAGGFMSSLFSMTVKYPEPDDFFAKKKGYIEDLEHNLRTFYKSLELIASQRVEIAAVVGEIATIVEELADLEILRTTSDLLLAFAEVHSKLKENLDRVNLQDQLTLGFTIEEYLRIIGSVKYTFETRSKIYQLYQSFKQELMKKEESLDRLNSRYKTPVDKISLVSFEVDKLKQKVAHYEESFTTISETIKAELDTFEMDKIRDFRNSVEIFIESSIESQKEAIELWETFYERQNLALV